MGSSQLDDLKFEILADLSETNDALNNLGNQLDLRFDQVDVLNSAFRNLSVSNRSLGDGPKISKPAQEMSFVDIAATAVQLTLLSKASSTMLTVGRTMDSVSRSTAVTASKMDRFRMGLQAVPVNPALNFAKHGLDAVGAGASSAIDKLRGVADAILSDLPGAASAAVGALGTVNQALDSSTATASKHVSKLHQMQGSLTLLSTVFPFAADTIARFRAPLDAVTTKAEEFTNGLESMNAKVATTATDVRGSTYVMSGAWTKLAGSADLFSRSQYYALLPARLMFREFEGGQRILKVATYAWAGLTHPIHAVSMAVAKSRAEWQDLNSRLPRVNTVLSMISSGIANVTTKIGSAAGGEVGRFTAVFTPLTTRLNSARVALQGMASSGIGRVTAVVSPLTSRLAAASAATTRFVSSLEFGTRAHRLFAQSAYLVGTATRATVSVMTPLVRVSVAVGKGLWSIVSPAKSAATSLLKLTGVQNTFIGKALGMKKAGDDANNTLSKMDAASDKASNGVGGFGSRAGMMKTAAAGLLAGMVALGTSTAVATEKNAAIFGTMLHDVDQGAAVVKSIQGTQAAKFFDNQELLDSGRLLYKAGVNATDLGAKTDQFSKIAVGASVDLGMLADRYMQGFSQGHFGLGQINDIAREGVAIYAGLEAATGKSGDELQKMIADGKIGMTEMDAALAHLTEGNGIYAGSLDAMATTTSGKMSMIKNNVSQALGSVMGVALQVLSPFGTAIVSLSEQFKSAFESFRGPVIYASTAVAWFFGNFINLSKFAFLSFALFSVTAFNDFIHFFTTSLPAYLAWFGANWKQVFWDAGNLVLTVFQNMGKNIWAIMKGIWAFIASGGQTELKVAFVPLLDGFKATVSELPNVPKRAMTELEKNLQAQTESLGGGLANSFDQMLADASQSLSPTVEIKDSNGDVVKTGKGSESAADKANKAATENKAAFVRSSEGQSVVAQFARAMGKGDKEKKAQQAQIDAAKDIKDIAREVVRNGKPLTAKKF